MTYSMTFLYGHFKASGTSPPHLKYLGGGRELQVFGKIIDTVVDRSNWTVWEQLFGSPGMEDGPYFGLDDVNIICPTILAFQDFLNFSMSLDTHLRYDRKDMYKVLEDTFTQRHLELMAPTGREFAVWSGILTINQPGWPSLGDESLELYVSNARADVEMKGRFFDDPERRPLTELEEWQIMCAMKTVPNAARFLHLAWAAARGNTFFLTKEGYLGDGSNKMVVGDKVALIQGVKLPMILRVAETQSGTRYNVVGLAYVHGMMDGELWQEGEVESLLLI